MLVAQGRARCALSSVTRRFRSAAIWFLAAIVAGLALFALIGSVATTPVFSPLSLWVPSGAVLLVGLMATTFAGVGALIAVRVRRNLIGWFLLAIGACIAVTLASIEYVALDLPGAQWAEWASQWVSVLPFAFVAYVLLLFPDGRLVSPRWRPALWLTDLALLTVLIGGFFTPYLSGGDYAFDNPVGIGAIRGSVLQDSMLGFVLLPFAIVAGAASFVVRYRRSSGARRAQLKWFALAAAVVAAAYLFENLTWLLSLDGRVDLTALGVMATVLAFYAVPIASGFAILRYRLYDIDRVVSRTVSYVLVTGIVVGVFLAVVGAATTVLPTHSSLAVAGATLLAAATFEPARRRVQAAVDRRFNREHYDANRLVDEYADSLRESLDPTQAQHLLDIVARTVQPSTLSLWRRVAQAEAHAGRPDPEASSDADRRFVARPHAAG